MKIRFLLLAMLLALPLAACEKKGPMEKAGEQIDEAVEDAGNAVEDACEDAMDARGAEDKDC
jgi:predicted small lipoprotein YifL